MSDHRRQGRMTGLSGVLAELTGGRATGSLARSRIMDHWTEIVGETVAKHCWPVAVQPPKLIIGIGSPTWHTTLRSMQPRLLKAVAQHCPELGITEIRMQLGRQQTTPLATPPGLAEPLSSELDAMPLTIAVEDQILRTVAAIDDPDVRERVASAMRAQRRLRQWRLAHGWRLNQRTGQLIPPE